MDMPGRFFAGALALLVSAVAMLRWLLDYAGREQMLRGFGVEIKVVPGSAADHFVTAIFSVHPAVYVITALGLLVLCAVWPLVAHFFGAPANRPRFGLEILNLAHEARGEISGYAVVLIMNVENRSDTPGGVAELDVQLIAKRKRYLGRLISLPSGISVNFPNAPPPFQNLRWENSLGDVGTIPRFEHRTTFQIVTFENAVIDDRSTAIVAARVRAVSGPWSRWCRRKLELKQVNG